MRKIAIVFLILLIGIAIVLLPIQGTQEEQHRPSYTVGVVLKAWTANIGWLCAPACSRRHRNMISAWLS
ncbi:hypothetical protein [Mitsuokella multacida]|uniref:hypothetical protein n=1 Tax=Mitsuokella multacida TaxID=52226 RepID=UPI003FEE2769